MLNFNLVHNFLIVLIWSSTFLVLCQFTPCYYFLDGKNWYDNDMTNETKKLFSMLHQMQL